MSIIQFKEANCKNCYKCIRNCDLKAIKFGNDQARILEDECILCGKCTLVCPQNAKQITSDLPQIQKFMADGSKMIASVAPSYVSAFPNVSFSKLSAALKKLGFSRVEEVAIGATEVSKEYSKLLTEKKMRNIITTCCPTSIMLVEKYYPELIDCLAPVVSPARAHAKMLKEIYGSRIKVVFLGPCISKKHEANQSNDINAVLMFDELVEWMAKEGVQMNEDDPEVAEMHTTKSRLYPVPGGIIHTIPSEHRRKYKCISVDGLDRCITILDSIRDHEIEGYFIEMSSCNGSCVEGPGLHNERTPFLISKDMLLSNAIKKTSTAPVMTENVSLDFGAAYNHTKIRDKIPDDDTIREILARIGKTTEETLLNCGTCGYATCWDKAIAVYQGKADLKMCLPYMREKAESMSNIILENMPDATFLLDKEWTILEYNKAAREMFHLTEGDTIGMPIEMFLCSEDFNMVRTTGQAVYDARCKTPNGELIVQQSIVTIANGDHIVILKDVTKEEEGLKEIEKIRKETIETAQKVIDKQMRVAQEIASLLGETTGETKAALTNLKKSMGGHL